MRILHIAAHLGDGAGKAIGGLARLDSAAGNENKILLLQEPQKLNHIEQCRVAGIEILRAAEAENAIEWADVVVLNWWGSPAMETFLHKFPCVPCRVLLWVHKNGFYDPPLPQTLVDACDGLLVTTPWSLTRWPDATLVYGFGDFAPEQIEPKTDYTLRPGEFRIGYIGSPSYKKLPPDTMDYFRATLDAVPDAHFILAGETSDEFRRDVESAGLSEYVELLGWTANVYDLLRSFDVFGYLLRKDTFATTENAVLEAMAVGLPVVMTREPLGKYIVGKAGGMLADTPFEYVSAMKAFRNDVVLRQRMGTAARDYSIAVYDRRKNLYRFQTACAELTGKEVQIHKYEVGRFERQHF